MVRLAAEDLSLGYDTVSVVEDLTMSIPEGKVSILIGANGCGKSTILRSLARLLKPKTGVVYLDGKNITRESTKEVAKKLSILPQGPQAPEGLTVKDLCYYGRHPYKSLLSKNTQLDHDMVEWALDATRMLEFSERSLDGLSGGQRQRAWVAMALCQGTDLILLDEPTTYLDLAHQIELLDLLKDLNKQYKRTIVMVLHDLNQAASYADHLISISNGKIYSEGCPKDTFTEQMISEVFGLHSQIIENPVNGSPMCLPVKVCGKEKNQKLLM
ncbi:ABC transporter ATP-binding protein [Bacillus spongiae]|uniref:ABC transporter ATP-binding protein n=1 Tax=Bacillus spongiae TaxID=2683610 RepID=A0ABU8H9C9_9BACI